MKMFGMLLLALTGIPLAAFLRSPDGGGGDEPQAKPVYDEQADAHADIGAALARAKVENKRVLIQWGANWCIWCKRLAGLCASDKPIAKELLYEYEVVHADIGKWDKNLDLAATYGADLKGNGVPFLTILDADGKPLVNQESGALEEGEGHDPAKVLAFLKEHQAKPLEAQAVLADALAHAKEAKKPVLLTFGAPWCPWCHRFEGWLRSPEASPLVDAHFVVQKIDVDRMVGGQDLLTHTRGSDEGGIPWFCFLDGEGNVLATSTGPKGNLGCPWADEEIALFQGILRQADPSLTDDELATVKQTLVAQRERATQKS